MSKNTTLRRCRNDACPNAEFFTTYHGRRQTWHLCKRCFSLRRAHRMTLTDLVVLWQRQGGACFCCGKALPDPRSPGIADWRGAAHIDHNHAVHPQKNHSCAQCRRGLACPWCNQNGPLSKRGLAVRYAS
jgi:hypothetical protein